MLTITPPRITPCLSFTQIHAVEEECQNYQLLAQSVCGRPFKLADLLRHRQEKRLELVKVIAERSKYNLEQWKVEQEVKAIKRHEKNEKDRLALMQQIEEIRAQKLQKRREEVEADRKYLRQSELTELALIERENEQRRKNIEYYTELSQIVDAQQKRTDTEIEVLKSKLSQNNESEDGETTLVNVVKRTMDSEDEDSMYFDANKSLTSSTSSKAFQSPEAIKTPDTTQTPEMLRTIASITRSASDIINSNVVDNLGQDRARNRANVLNSNINLATCVEVTQKVKILTGSSLTEAQKNKLKALQPQYQLVDSNANAEEQTFRAFPAKLTEFGSTEVVVNVTTENRCTDAFNNDKFEQLDELNANKPLSDLQNNRQKVLIQEYGTKLEDRPTSDTTTLRNKLKASLSLNLYNEKSTNTVALSPKACQSDFIMSPMSTTSDELMACSINEPNLKKAANDQIELKLDCSSDNRVNFKHFTSETADQVTPLSALNTSGIEKIGNGFEFNAPYKSQPTFSQILRPSSGSSSIFDISSRLSATKNSKITPSSPVNQSSKSLSKSELQDLRSGNLAYFLEQSFTIPLNFYSNILNNEILKIFFYDLEILGHFESLRNYFFMIDGQFASNICEGLLNKLQVARRPTELLNSYALHSILESALQSSLSGINKNMENLSFYIPNVPDKFEMSSPNVLSELHLIYKVDWPLNLLLSNEAIEHYDKVFQHLLRLRRIRWLLDECLFVSLRFFLVLFSSPFV